MNYVVGGYLVTIVTLVGYGISLVLRDRRARRKRSGS